MSRVRAVAVPGLLLVLALTIQVSFLGRLGLPGAAPDLVLVVVAAIAFARGPSAGAFAGFAGGLLTDLAPPADHPAGLWALVGTLAGYAAGSLPWRAIEVRPSIVASIGGLTGAATAAAVLVEVFVGGWWPGLARLGELAATQTAYATLLAVVVLPAVRPLLRWSSRRETAWALR